MGRPTAPGSKSGRLSLQMACPLRNLLVIFSAVLMLYLGISSYWKTSSVEEAAKPAPRQVRTCPLLVDAAATASA